MPCSYRYGTTGQVFFFFKPKVLLSGYLENGGIGNLKLKLYNHNLAHYQKMPGFNNARY